MFIAAAARETRHIRLGTGVVSLPYHHPFTLASRMMQLDHMTRGRAMFGVGPGSLIYDAEKIGLKAADQRRRMDESLDCIMQLMQGEIVTRKTDWFTLNEAKLQLVPYSRPHIEMAVASSRSPVGAVASAEPRTKLSLRTPRTGPSTRMPRARPARPRTARVGASSRSLTSQRRVRRRAPTSPTASPTSTATSMTSPRSRSCRQASTIHSTI
jgi:alkanesulfonate monooxygenase SsuD/methylene tetrahydromethanopterin reductase-like flavin-dependent oxidoreductase (luciferase family)